jgi:signal transduction histidine kinase
MHTTESDVIALGSALTKGKARFWVRDTGAGIPSDQQSRIFERFARGEGRRRSEGAGLGLSIVRAIAEAHGGSVKLSSQPGRGSTFSIIIPFDSTQWYA